MPFIGIALVLLGAICYGLPASLFKLAQQQGASTANLVLSQFFCASCILGVLKLCSRQPATKATAPKKPWVLLLSGASVALTNTFYFSSLAYVSVAIAAVMLMQSVWIAIIFDYLFKRLKPNRSQILAVFLVLIGTVLATQLLVNSQQIAVKGLLLSFLSGVCYAATIMVTNSLRKDLPPISRAFWIALGAFIFTSLIWLNRVDWSSLLASSAWGALIALFSLVLPLLCFSRGMPLISASLGGLLASIELPAAILFAVWLLHESISHLQVLGIICILLAISLPQLIWLIRQQKS